MEKRQNRRDFLKKTGVVAGLSQLPLLGWSTGFSTLLSEGVNPAGEFSLLKLDKLLTNYQFPFVDEFSTTSFNTHYSQFNSYGSKAVRAGELSLHSILKGESQQFDFVSSRLANNGIKGRNQIFKYLVSGSVHCETNATLTPQKWKVATKIALSEEESAFGGTGTIGEGKVKSGEIQIQSEAKLIRKQFGNQQLSWKWGLIAVVQKMAEASTLELQFAMLDEFDAVYQNQKLRFRRNARIDCGSDRLIDFKVFELTGDGVLPTVYWVDHLNRTVFVICGMEAFVLGK